MGNLRGVLEQQERLVAVFIIEFRIFPLEIDMGNGNHIKVLFEKF